MAEVRYCDLTAWDLDPSESPSDSSVLDEYTDTLTNVRYKDLIIIDCAGTIPPLLEDCTDICINDETYYNLYDADSILNLQFQFDNDIEIADILTYGWDIGSPANYFIQAWAVDCCNESSETAIEDIVDGTNYYVGKIEESVYGAGTIYHDVQGIKIDTSLVTYDCFYLKIRVHHDLSGTNYTEYFTQPYKAIDCRHKDVATIVSDYDYKDDIGYYYVLPDFSIGEGFLYENTYIVRGEFLQVQIDFNKEFLNENTVETSSNQVNRYRLRTYKLNESAVNMIANIINGYNLYVNSTLVIIDGSITKNFDEGKSWLPDIYFREFKDTQDFTCI